MSSETAGENAPEWRLGPFDGELGKWVFRTNSSSSLAKYGVLGFHIGGVYGNTEAYEYALAILNEQEKRISQLEGALEKIKNSWGEQPHELRLITAAALKASSQGEGT